MARRSLTTTVKRTCYLARPHSLYDLKILSVVRDAAEKSGIEVMPIDDLSQEDSSTILSKIAVADFLIAETTSGNPNVFLELGIALSMGKTAICLIEEQFKSSFPNDLKSEGLDNVIFVEYSSRNHSDLYHNLVDIFRNNRAISTRRRPSLSRTRLPFFIDWDLLDPGEIENLCQELLVQMGFRRVQWRDSIRGIDMIAEFPRKDPDGFEFRELWLIALGQRSDPRGTLEMALHDPSYFYHRISTYSQKLSQLVEDNPVSLLVIAMSSDDLSAYETRYERRSSRPDLQSQFRIRVWDRSYMTSLVQRYPSIAYKYFSAEGRTQSKFRKSFEELYSENASLIGRQRALIVELKAEKDKRVRAERDAVWKDISFAAAHKIGNPIFAIETGLEPLVKRMNEGRLEEAADIAAIIGRSVNKAKAVVEQFKSLAKSQQIDATEVNLLALINEATEALKSQNISLRLDVAPNLLVLCDPEKIEECFDELSMNAIRWLEKSGKDRNAWCIEISAAESSNRELPDSLEIGKKYAVINFRDNGIGVPIDRKNKIFDAFVSDYEHGTGLGLALVRRIIEGHGGAIVEVGKPDEGADFEIYLPLVVGFDESSNPKAKER